MPSCVISNYSTSCTVDLPSGVGLVFRFVFPLIPLFIIPGLYFYSLIVLQLTENLIGLFSVCVMLACVIAFIVENIFVALISGFFSSVSSLDERASSQSVINLSIFERALGIIFIIFTIVFKLS